MAKQKRNLIFTSLRTLFKWRHANVCLSSLINNRFSLASLQGLLSSQELPCCFVVELGEGPRCDGVRVNGPPCWWDCGRPDTWGQRAEKQQAVRSLPGPLGLFTICLFRRHLHVATGCVQGSSKGSKME